MEEVLEVLRCPICYSDYSVFISPYLLSCGHSVCSECFSKIKRESMEDEDYYTDNSEEDDSKEEYDTSLISKSDHQKDDDYDDSGDSSDDGNSGDDDDHCDHNCSEENDEGCEDKDQEDDDNDEDDNNDHDDEDEDEEDNSLVDNVIIPNEEANKMPQSNKNLTKFKYKCPFCSKKRKITNEDVIINQSVIDFMKANSKETIETKQVFCRQCLAIDTELSHLSTRSLSHKEHLKELSQESFALFKEYSIQQSEDFPQSKSITSALNTFLSSFLSKLATSEAIQLGAINRIADRLKQLSYASHLSLKGRDKLMAIFKTYQSFITAYEKESDPMKKKALIRKMENCYQIGLEFYNSIFVLISNPDRDLTLPQGNESSSPLRELYFHHFNKSIIRVLSDGFFNSIFTGIFHSESCFSLKNNAKEGRMIIFNTNLNVYDEIYNFTHDLSASSCHLINKEGTVIYILGENKVKSHVFQSFDLMKSELFPLANIPTAFFSFDSIVYRKSLFIIGGESARSDITDKCFVYDINANAWTALPSLKMKKKKKAIAVVNERLYSFGGKGKEISMSYQFEFIDLEFTSGSGSGAKATRNEWTAFAIQDYHEAIYKFGFCFLNEHSLVILGGENRTVEDYEKKGYLIDLRERKLKESFNISFSFYNDSGRNCFNKGQIYCLNRNEFAIDLFDLWNQLTKIKHTII